MLVISRCTNSAIRIGDQIKIKVLRLGQRRVVLGVDAPSDVRVRRDELLSEACDRSESPARALDLRVLVVEDDPAHARLIEHGLRSRGVKHVVRTASGVDAIRLLRLSGEHKAIRPDLVLLNLQLPDVSGFHVLRTIKTTAPLRSIPVVVLGGSDSDADVARCMESGANAFVSKAESDDRFRQSIMRIADFWSGVRRVGEYASHGGNGVLKVRAT